MDETHYSISETGKLVGVESHVLRYWEEELELNIPRNGKDHRYYTELHIRLFQKIKELKEKGYQLKAIKQVITRMMAGDTEVDPDRELEQDAVHVLQESTVTAQDEEELQLVQKKEQVVLAPEKLEQFQALMNHVIGQAVNRAMADDRERLGDDISRQVSEHMMQELEYMMRVNDEKEEERFKQLDETLRAYQKEGKGRAEAAAAKMPFFKRKKWKNK